MKVVGIREVKYTSKKTGNDVHGYDLYVELPSSKVQGVMTDKLFLSDYIIDKNHGKMPALGDEVNVFYNRFGRIESYEVAPGQV